MRWNLLITAPGFKYTISLPKLESSSKTTELAVFGTIDVVETIKKKIPTLGQSDWLGDKSNQFRQ